jgi:hypothetical protein
MSALAWLTCKAFIEKQSPQEQKRLMEFLPPKERKQLQALRFANPGWEDSDVRIESALDLVHPSWILPLLHPTLTMQEIGFILASLAPHQASALKSQLHYMRPLPSLTPLGKSYLRNDLLQKIPGADDLIPMKALPESPLNILASFSFMDLLKLIFSLGLKDLSQYLKLVIDKNKRKNIEAALSPEEWKSLEHLSMKKDPLAGGKEIFDTWTGEPEKLRILIEQRGINRLAKALFGEHPALLWYVMHILDSARANFLYKLCSESPSKATHDFLKEQIVETAQTFKSG